MFWKKITISYIFDYVKHDYEKKFKKGLDWGIPELFKSTRQSKNGLTLKICIKSRENPFWKKLPIF